ncbi:MULTISPECIES: LIC12162 family transferase [unclassified Campylobacter]|uniref:LIC12162 family transferase n=1 Tax=unclassified Campylobacter TaxID=2593542 RepID=UPI003D33EB7E
MSKKFLCTTGLEESWDLNAQSYILLGEYYESILRKKLSQNSEIIALDYLWKDEENIDKGISFCKNTYEKTIEYLTKILNQYHGVNKDILYWKRLMGSWLYLYIMAIYDRYSHLKLAYSKFDDLFTNTMDTKAYSFIGTSDDYFKLICTNDYYNLQLYSQIINYLNLRNKIIDVKPNFVISGIRINQSKFSIKSTLKKIVYFIVARGSSFLNSLFSKNSVLVVQPYFKSDFFKKLLKLTWKSKFLFIFDNFQYKVSIDANPSLEQRKKLFGIKKFDNEFENLLFDTMVYNFPMIFLEAYHKFNSSVKRLNIKKIDALYSANALKNSEIFRFYASENMDNIKIIYSQHGGNYGIDKISINEFLEIDFSDFYFTYGWTNDEGKRIRPISQPPILSSNKSSNDIVLIMNYFSKYFYIFHYLEDAGKSIKYIENTKNFLLNFKYIDSVTIRPYMIDDGWNFKQRLLDTGLKLKFDNSTSYYKQIAESRLNIFDHMHTGFMESLSINKPTIVFIADVYAFRDDAKDYINLLIDANILFLNAERCAIFLNKIYDSVEKWWDSDAVQKARMMFLDRYFKTSDNWVDEWVAEFNGILEK